MNVSSVVVHEQRNIFTPVHSVCSVITDNILTCMCEGKCIYEGGGLRLTIYSLYSWEMALNVSPCASFENVCDWKGIQEKAGESVCNNDESSVDFQRVLR
jgi:hypothetical protein